MEKKRTANARKTGKTAKPKPGAVKKEKEPKARPLKFIRSAAKDRFLNVFANCGNIKKSCKIADISRATHYRWMSEDDAYVVAFEKARKMAGELLEDEAWRRAVEGDEIPIINGKGQKVGSRFYRSDKLLIELLKANKPEKYGTERIRNETVGDGSSEITWKDGE